MRIEVRQLPGQHFPGCLWLLTWGPTSQAASRRVDPPSTSHDAGWSGQDRSGEAFLVRGSCSLHRDGGSSGNVQPHGYATPGGRHSSPGNGRMEQESKEGQGARGHSGPPLGSPPELAGGTPLPRGQGGSQYEHERQSRAYSASTLAMSGRSIEEASSPRPDRRSYCTVTSQQRQDIDCNGSNISAL